MKIKSVDIASFGKFKNFHLDFADGFNVVYGENEKGKSTIMAFIKMMFYGNGGKSADALKNPRKKYMPWDSSFMAGSITFCHNGYDYRLEREFKGSNSTDKIILKNITLDKSESLSGKNDVGTELFGLSLAAFEKSVFIGGLGAPEKNASAEGELTNRLSNMVSSADEDISFETVYSRLKKAKETLLSKSGRIGVLDKALVELETLDAKIREAENIETKIKELEQIIAKKESEASLVKAEADRCFEIMKKAELFKKRANLLKYIEAEEEREKALQYLELKDGHATKDTANEIRETAGKLSSTEKSLSNLSLNLNALNEEIETLSEALSDEIILKLKEQKSSAENRLFELEQKADDIRKTLQFADANSNKSGKRKPSVALIIGVILAAVFLSALFALHVKPLYSGICIIGASAGILLALVGLFKKGNGAKTQVQNELSKKQNELDGILTQIASTRTSLDTVSSSLNSVLIEQGGKKALLEAKQSDKLKLSNTILEFKEEILTLKAKLSAMSDGIGNVFDYDSAIHTAEFIEQKLGEVAAAEIKKNLAADLTNCTSLEEAKRRIAELNEDKTLLSVTAEEAEKAKDTIRTHTLQSSKLREELASLKSNIKILISSADSLSTLTAERESLVKKIESQKTFCSSVDKTLEVLEQAAALLRQNYGGKLQSLTAEIFKNLTEGKYSSVEVSRELEISVEKEDVFGAKSWQFLSAGTADQAYLSLRLALASLLNDEERLPVIMDDVLAQYDDKRTLRAVEFLTSFSKEHQVILFTCHSSLKETAQKFDSAITEL